MNLKLHDGVGCMQDYGTASGYRDYVHELECLRICDDYPENGNFDGSGKQSQYTAQIRNCGGGVYSGNCDVLGFAIKEVEYHEQAIDYTP